MSIVCPICNWWACTCNGSRCHCWLSETEITASLTKELQEARLIQPINNNIEYILPIEDDDVCLYDKYWAWGKCIYCWNYKRYKTEKCSVRLNLKNLQENV